MKSLLQKKSHHNYESLDIATDDFEMPKLTKKVDTKEQVYYVIHTDMFYCYIFLYVAETLRRGDTSQLYPDDFHQRLSKRLSK